MKLEIISSGLLDAYTKAAGTSPLNKVDQIRKIDNPFDHFQFYKSISSVYSSRIEGEDIDFDSYVKHKFLKVTFKPDYTRRADDVFAAYEYIDSHRLNLKNVRNAHSILSANLLPVGHQGASRRNPMFVLNNEDRIEYVAADPKVVESELLKLFADIDKLVIAELNPYEIFYYAAMIHVVFVKIHPFQDGNGRTARLIEKWFLISKIGATATFIQLEKNYYLRQADYYSNIQKLGLEYDSIDYSKALDFVLMTVEGIDRQGLSH